MLQKEIADKAWLFIEGVMNEYLGVGSEGYINAKVNLDSYIRFNIVFNADCYCVPTCKQPTNGRISKVIDGYEFSLSGVLLHPTFYRTEPMLVKLLNEAMENAGLPPVEDHAMPSMFEVEAVRL